MQALHGAPIIVVAVDQACKDAIAAAVYLNVRVDLRRMSDILVIKLVLALPSVSCIDRASVTAATASTTSYLERLALRPQCRHVGWIGRSVVGIIIG